VYTEESLKASVLTEEVRAISSELEDICLEALGPDARQLAMVQHVKKLKQLSMVVRFIGCIIIAVVCAYYVTAELAASDSHVAGAVRWALGLFLLFFILFVWGAFRRLWQAMRDSMESLPVYRMTVNAVSSDWSRALAVFLLLPAVPCYLAISALNQQVRHWRGLRLPDAPDKAGPGKKAPQARCRLHLLTEKVQAQVRSVLEWDPPSILDRVYIIGIAFILYTTCPLLLNVVLAWLRTLLTEVPFVPLLFVFFMIGLFCFLLPPVPGPPVYLFGGVLLAEYCPWGFWPGTIICILVSWLLKLTACAMQQKCIGELLRSSTWVRQTCRVHTPLLRAIEAVLREKGFTMGKITILCGGPDWPTSVGAGVLGLPLWEMLVGTLPIIFFVAPCVMTGSFYLRREESDVWLRASSLMLSATVIVCIILWIGAVWAVQQVLDRRYEELNCPRLADLQLAWLDWRQAQIQASCRAKWSETPTFIVVLLILGALWLICVGHLYYWLPGWCFGSFAVTDDIEDFRWIEGDDALFKFNGLLGLCLSIGSLMFIGTAKMWASISTTRARQQTVQRLAKVEDQWKAMWIEEAYEAHDCLEAKGAKSCCHLDFKKESVSPKHGPSEQETPEAPIADDSVLSLKALVLDDKDDADCAWMWPLPPDMQDCLPPDVRKGLNTSASSTGIDIDGHLLTFAEGETPARNGGFAPASSSQSSAGMSASER